MQRDYLPQLLWKPPLFEDRRSRFAMVDAEDRLFALQQIEIAIRCLGQNQLIFFSVGRQEGKATDVMEKSSRVTDIAVQVDEPSQPLANHRCSQIVSPTRAHQARAVPAGE